MESISWQAIGQTGRRSNMQGLSCLLLFGAVACGGQALDEAALVPGGGGQTSTVTPSSGGQTATTAPTARGGTTATTTTTSVSACYGRSDIAVVPGCATVNIDPFKESDTSCLMMLTIMPNYKLNPAKLTLYFTASNGAKYVIPYIGTLADCAAQTANGGWYATNISGGSSEIGLCPCNCTTAHKHAVTAVVACDGIPAT
jgi:hypothetical protein